MIRKNKPSQVYLDTSQRRSPRRDVPTFGKAERFITDKSFSPNKYYDLPDSIDKRGAGIGFGKKIDLILKDMTEPARYFIRSEFDEIADGYRFGMRPQSKQNLKRDHSFTVLRGNTDSSSHMQRQNKQSPQRKQAKKSHKGSPEIRRERIQTEHTKKRNVGSAYQISKGSRKENFPKERKSAMRLKYEYSQNYLLGNNRTSYTQFIDPSRSKSPILPSKKSIKKDYYQQQRTKNSFKDHPLSKKKPGYTPFSQFGGPRPRP